MRKFLYTHFPAILIALIILTLTSIPRLTPPDLGIKMQDKIFHTIAYFIFGMTLIHSGHFIFNRKIHILIYTVGIGLSFAALDELHQVYIPGRMSSVYDFFADGIGVILALPLFLCWFRCIILRYQLFFY